MRNPISLLGRPRAEAAVPTGSVAGSRPGVVMPHQITAGKSGPAQIEASGLLFQIAATRARRLAAVTFELVAADRGQDRTQEGLADNELYDRPHVAHDVWRRINPHWNHQEFIELWSMWWDLLGEVFIVPTTLNGQAQGMPVELWPLEPWRMTPVTDPAAWITEWKYRSPDSREYSLDPDELWFTRFPHPSNPYRGIGALPGVQEDLASSIMSGQWQSSFYRNSAQPGAVIETEEELTEPQFKRLKREVREMWSGPSNVGKPWLLEQGKLNFTSWSPREMDQAKVRPEIDNTVREAFGIAKTILGQTEDVNRATADTARMLEAENNTVPKATRLAQWLNTEYLPAFGALGEVVAYRFVDPTPELPEIEAVDRDSRVNLFNALVAAGADPSDAVSAAGLPEIPFEARSPAPAPPLPEPDGDEGEGEPVASLVAGPVVADTNPTEPATTGPAPILPHLFAQGDPPDDEPIDPNLLVMQEDFELALAALMALFLATRDRWVAWLVEQIEARLEAGKPIGNLSVPVAMVRAGADLIFDAESKLGEQTAQRAVEELREVVGAEGVERIRETKGQGSQAHDTAWLVAGGLVASLAGEAIRLKSPDVPVSETVSAVKAFADGLKRQSEVERFKQVLTAAQNRARIAVFNQAARAGLINMVASEELDSNTCGPCAAIDGTVFETGAEARAAYPTGGFKDCEGRHRCRGTVVARRRRS